MLIGMLFGLWIGSGLSGVVLVWKRNPEESWKWKLPISVVVLTKGPFNLMAVR